MTLLGRPEGENSQRNLRFQEVKGKPTVNILSVNALPVNVGALIMSRRLDFRGPRRP
jgi:hypothetical protein